MRRAMLFSALALAVVMVASATQASAKKPTLCDGMEATITGTTGDDVIDGTDGDDVIVGLGGDDAIRGGLGEDVICGGPGDDNLAGQGDDDLLFGDPGEDVLDGGEGGCCFMPTNSGDDVLHGGPGADDLHTSDFPTLGNTLHGEQGNDNLFVWSGGLAFGGNGDDVIRQFTGDAEIDGGNGDDDILDWDDSGIQNETLTLTGGRGDDTVGSEDATSTADIDGGQGTDTCFGGDTTANCEA